MNTYMKHNDLIALLLSAISRAITYDDKESQTALINAGMSWAKSEDEETDKDAWHKVALAAKWINDDD